MLISSFERAKIQIISIVFKKKCFLAEIFFIIRLIICMGISNFAA